MCSSQSLNVNAVAADSVSNCAPSRCHGVWKWSACAVVWMLLISSTASGATLTPGYGTLTPFTGGDVGEGLDLEGQFAHAYNFGATSGSTVIRNATFVSGLSNPPGLTVSASSTLDYFGVNGGNFGMEYGASANDNALESVMNSATYGGNWNLDLQVTTGQEYKLQIILQEPYRALQNGGSRNYDILHETTPSIGAAGNSVIVGAFTSGLDTNGFNNPGTDFGLVYTYQFTAQDDFFNIQFRDIAGGDSNALLEALTLETIVPVPEPSSMVLLGLGAIGLMRRTHRRTCRRS